MKSDTNLVIHGPCAIASETIKQKHTAFYIRLPKLLELYNNIRNDGKSLSQTVQKYAKYELLILDEWLMYEMSDQDKQFISELIEIRDDTCLTIFCSQYLTEDWYDKLHKSSTLTEALLDRIVHNRIDIDMGTENFKIK